jgi:hypothetical protein
MTRYDSMNAAGFSGDIYTTEEFFCKHGLSLSE